MKSLLNIRPFQLILMAVFVVFALAGLLAFSTFKGFGGGTQIGAVTIWGTLPAAALTQELTAITQSDKGYGKVTYVEKQSSTFDSDLANAIASGSGPDLVLISQEQLLTEESRLRVIPFSSIPQRTYLNTYLPEDSLFLTSSGTYGVPYVIDPLVLYYNKDSLASAGVVTPPATWEAVMGLTGNLTTVAAGGTLAKSTIALGTYSNIANARAILSLLFFQAGNTITAENTAGTLSSTLAQSATTATGVPPAQSALNFYTQFADPSRTVYSWNQSEPDAFSAFTTGDTALYVGYASEEPTISATNPNLNFDMSYIPQPQNATTKTDYGLAYAFAIPKASVNPSGAYAAAQMLSAPAYLSQGAQTLSMAPANRMALTIAPSNQFQPVYFPMALISQGWLSPAPAVVDDLFSRMITSVISGQYQVADALSRASQALTADLTSS